MRETRDLLICVPFTSPLREGDSETQTIGCRSANRYTCARYQYPGLCAFVRDDLVCRCPSAWWKKQYNSLKGFLETDKD
jgi:hypothetical protein